MCLLHGHVVEWTCLTDCTACVQEPDATKQYPGCPAAGGVLKARGQGQDQGRQQDAETPRSFVFNELSLEEIKLVESTLVKTPAATLTRCLVGAAVHRPLTLQP